MQNNDTDAVEKAKKAKKPDDFESVEDFLTFVRKSYADDVEWDEDNRLEASLDAKFVAGRQWDENVYQKRIRAGKPALTINRLPAFVAQVVGNRRLNDTTIKIIPDHDGDKEVARVREGLVRNIVKNSCAKRAFDSAFQNQVIGGLGNFQVVLDYAEDDVFDQDILVQAIYDDSAVVWDRMSQDPTGADARHVFVSDRVTLDDFKRRYPNASASSFALDQPDYQSMYAEGWVDQDTVRIVDFWRVRSRKRMLALMLDGSVLDVTDRSEDDPNDLWMQNVAVRANGAPIMRESRIKYAEMYRCSGADVLEGPYTLPIKRVPVFRVPGWEINTGDYKTRFGLVRWLRDPQRLHNLWRSVITEKLMLTPKSKWLVGKTAAQGYEDAFRRAHLSNDPVLFWNDEAGNKPELIPPAQMEAALIQEAGMAAQDIKDVSNLHEASLGQTSNEVSGKAIMARQRVGETGTTIYQDNMNAAIEECGRVINDLIPYVYDAPRVVKVLGGDEEFNAEYVRINFGDESSIDITKGKYNVTVVTGPAYATKRIEAAESMMAAVNAMPDAFGVAADLIAEAQDWPKADLIARRLRSRMPPDMLDQDDISPEQQQQMAAQAQMQQEAAEIAKQQALAEIELKRAQAQATLAQAQAAIVRAQADAASIGREDAKAEAALEKTAADIESMQTKDQLQTIDALTGENNV